MKDGSDYFIVNRPEQKILHTSFIMKKRLLPIALLLGAISANAQVGIGTPMPNKSAELTIEATDRGVLIPHIALLGVTDTTTITNGNLASLLVYNTTTNETLKPGYYYWFENNWQRLTIEEDIPAVVVNHFNQILKLDDEKVTKLIKNIVKNTEGNVIYEGDKLYYIGDDGNKIEISFEEIVQQYETVTVLGYDSGTGVLTYSNEEGQAFAVSIKEAVEAFETVTSIAINPTLGTITFKDEAGSETILELSDLVKSQETVTVLERLEVGKYAYTNEAGVSSEISVIGDVTSVIRNNVTSDLYRALKQVVQVEQSLTSMIYDASTKKLVYLDEQETNHSVDLNAIVKENQYTTVVEEGDHLQIVKTVEGNVITYQLNVPTATQNSAGVVKPGLGLEIDATGTLAVNLASVLQAKNITGNEKIVVVDGVGAVLQTTRLDINEAKLSLQNIGGTLGVSQIEKGENQTVLVTDQATAVRWISQDSLIKAHETVTTLTNNGDGTITYTNEANNAVTIDLAEGPQGESGADGLSAYAIWLKAGNTGTEEEFLASLVGPRGATGLAGADGTNGIDGANGIDGLSAYAIWIKAGNTGTEEEFLASLVGPRGATGLAGADGTNGADGADGQKGDRGLPGIGGEINKNYQSQIQVLGEGTNEEPYTLGVLYNNGLESGTGTSSRYLQLGGELNKPTLLKTTEVNTLAIAGLDKRKTQAIAANEIADHLLAVDANNVMKALKAVMPKFFYMPSVFIPMAESQVTNADITFTNSSREGTIDLYKIYKKQFGQTVMSSAGATPLPVLKATDLGYHVTYATEDVFTIVSISDTGVLTYRVSATAMAHTSNFMNIVFTVNED